jgi:hypothetical protein
MSNEMPLIREPKGTPILTYEGPETIQTASGQRQLRIKADRRYFGEKDSTESCKLISATVNGTPVNFNVFITQGSLEGTFEEPSEGDGSIWRFDFKFGSSALYKPKERRDAMTKGIMAIHKTAQLQFLHKGIEHISRAVIGGRELSPCSEALREQETFVKQSSCYVAIEFICKFHKD